uniref:phosphatidylglycerophosphatase A family protein n=1 Tax=Alicyclobacillus tolerans TaxID=90970 RepID=UPI003557CA28
MRQLVVDQLKQRGVEIDDIAVIVYQLQAPYHASLTHGECRESVLRVLEKREVQHAVFTGIALDVMAEERRLPEPLQTIMDEDEPLYGVDEVLALAVTNVYGSIGLTNFGYLDKTKLGVIGKLNDDRGHIHVFLDDLVASLAASAAARIAHQHEAKSYQRADSSAPAKGDNEVPESPEGEMVNGDSST